MGLLHLEMLITSQRPAPPKALCTKLFSRRRSAAFWRAQVATRSNFLDRGIARHGGSRSQDPYQASSQWGILATSARRP